MQYLPVRHSGRLAIGRFNGEVILRRGPWRSLEDVEFGTLGWVWWFDYHRLLGPVGYVPAGEHEEAYYRRQEAPAEPATLN